MADPPLPVFVYGTLRRGGRFHHDLLAGRAVTIEPARLAGATMWDNHGAYPFVALVGAGSVLGELVTAPAGDHVDLLGALDHLEGHEPGAPDNLYERVIVEVETAEGAQRAWVYVRTDVEDLDRALPRIPGGDWFDRPD